MTTGMTKIGWGVAAVFFGTALAGSLPVRADSRGADKALILGAVRKMDEASGRRDAAAYSAFLHPQFANINLHGTQTVSSRDEQRQQLTALFGQTTQASQKTIVHSITFSSAGALVDQSSRNLLTLTRGGWTLKMTGGRRYRDLWVKQGGTWLEKRSQAVSEQFFVNGKPLP